MVAGFWRDWGFLKLGGPGPTFHLHPKTSLTVICVMIKSCKKGLVFVTIDVIWWKFGGDELSCCDSVQPLVLTLTTLESAVVSGNTLCTFVSG